MFATGRDAATIVEERGLRQVTDTDRIEALVGGVLAAHPDRVAEYRAGKTKLLGFFMGEVMKASRGRANPQAVNRTLRLRLGDEGETR